MRLVLSLSFFLLLGLLGGCASDPNMVELDLGPASLDNIRQSVFSVIGSPRTTSENQREYESEYFPRIPDAKFDATSAKERLYAKVLILGERRPYTLEIQTLVETKSSGYEVVGEDRTFSNKISAAIQKKLNQSLNHRNIIDDYKAF